MTIMESEIITASSIQEKRQSIAGGGGGGGGGEGGATAAAATQKSEIESNDFETDSLGTRRIYKKTSPNALVTLYLGTREIVSKRGVVGPLRGVLFVDPKYVVGHRLFCQLTLTFRYGREDEEVMGLKFCNEAVIALSQIWPRTEEAANELSPLQEALLERLGVGAHAFSVEVGIVAPPSVQLIPAKQYSGAPIGTSYDIRAYIADHADEKVQRRSTVKLGIRLVHRIPPEVRCLPSQTITNVSSLPKCLRLKLSPKAIKFSNKLCGGKTTGSRFTDPEEEPGADDNNNGQAPPPQGCVDKPFLWTEGKVSLRAALNKTAYGHEEKVFITVDVHNNSRKVIRKIRVSAVQHVDVCMFSNGKFKNIVAEETISEPLGPDSHFNRTFDLLPVRTPTKNWIAVEGALFNSSLAASTEAANSWSDQTRLAPSSPPELNSIEDRNVFAIYVSYYVKVKLTLSGMGGEVSLKLPFLLGHIDDESSEQNGDGSTAKACNGVVATAKNHRVVAAVGSETQCEVISELCEMSLSNNNLSTEPRTIKEDGQDGPSITDNGTRDNVFPQQNDSGNGHQARAAGPLDECVVEGDSCHMKEMERKKLRSGQEELQEVDDDDDDDEDDNNIRPVISVATTVQVHASGSRHSSLVTEGD